MCGIVAFTSNQVTKQDLKTLKKVLIESRIRGKHASGVAWWNYKGNLLSVVQPYAIDKLAEELDLSNLVYEDKITMIAHARYSTSDIRYNQPLKTEHTALAHNGVITQRPPEEWEEVYGYQCITKNDSELLLHCLDNQDRITTKFPGSSIACVYIRDGKLYAYRNKYRPLWMGRIGTGVVYASTENILQRAGVENITKVAAVNDLQNRSDRWI